MKTIKCQNNYGQTVELPLKKFKSRPSVYAIIRRGGYILTCRNKSDGKLWLPGGGIDENETHEQALRRECKEETGVTELEIKEQVGDYQNYYYYEPEDLAMHAHLHFYECITTQETLKSQEEIDDEEAYDLKWQTIEQISEKDFAIQNRKVYKILLAVLKPNDAKN